MEHRVGIGAVALALLFGGCTVNYSLSGGAVPATAKTLSVASLEARAPLCSPQTAQGITEALRDLMQAQTPLTLIQSSGDIAYDGAITGYDVQPVAIQANETAAMNRLTITVSVHFANKADSKSDADISVSRFADFPSSQDLSTVETGLVQEIGKQLAQDIFDRTLGNW
ncbi:MAG: LptE family protein [Bacteroidetes bacterium]|nr:LptE family protein [Bacteroidota bacterium]